jgi:hypothetical protein
VAAATRNATSHELVLSSPGRSPAPHNIRPLFCPTTHLPNMPNFMPIAKGYTVKFPYTFRCTTSELSIPVQGCTCAHFREHIYQPNNQLTTKLRRLHLFICHVFFRGILSILIFWSFSQAFWRFQRKTKTAILSLFFQSQFFVISAQSLFSHNVLAWTSRWLSP